MIARDITAKRAAERSSGFSLIELVIVVVIIAIIGAIAIPKMSRGAAGAADSAVLQDLSVLRSALDLYQAENGGNYPALTALPGALTTYNDGNGGVVAAKDSTHIYGPYLRAIPPLPVGAAKGGLMFAASLTAPTPGATGATTVGWIYNAATGQVTTNTTSGEVDTKNVAYSLY